MISQPLCTLPTPTQQRGRDATRTRLHRGLSPSTLRWLPGSWPHRADQSQDLLGGSMLESVRIRRPSQREIDARLARPDEPFGYPEVGATADLAAAEYLSGKYDLDRREFRLGSGRQLFESARSSLVAWRHFEIPWLELHGATPPVRSGQVVATLVRVAGFWFLNPCRVVYTELTPEPSNVAAFAYGTLRGHAECGEERFAVSFDPVTEEVRYEMLAFSRPAAVLPRLGYPMARRLQSRFAVCSAEALARDAALADRNQDSLAPPLSGRTRRTR